MLPAHPASVLPTRVRILARSGLATVRFGRVNVRSRITAIRVTAASSASVTDPTVTARVQPAIPDLRLGWIARLGTTARPICGPQTSPSRTLAASSPPRATAPAPHPPSATRSASRPTCRAAWCCSGRRAVGSRRLRRDRITRWGPRCSAGFGTGDEDSLRFCRFAQLGCLIVAPFVGWEIPRLRLRPRPRSLLITFPRSRG